MPSFAKISVIYYHNVVFYLISMFVLKKFQVIFETTSSVCQDPTPQGTCNPPSFSLAKSVVFFIISLNMGILASFNS